MKTEIISVPQSKPEIKPAYPSLWRLKENKKEDETGDVIVLRLSETQHICLHSQSFAWNFAETEARTSSMNIDWDSFARVNYPLAIRFNP